MRIGIIIFCLALTGTVWGQEIDRDRMEKDLEVAENVLSAMLKQDNDWPTRLLGGGEVAAEYIDDFGVVFTIESNSWINVTGKVKDCDDCDDEDIRYVVAPKVKIVDGQGGTNDFHMSFDSDGSIGSNQAKVKEIIRNFFLDYADLIGQLKPSDQIQVKYQNSNKGFEIFSSDGKSYNKKGGGYLSAMVVKADLSGYKSGKLSKEQLIEKIKFEESDGRTEKETDLELLSSIFNRLYKSDLSETYFISQGPEYERIDGLGIVYHMKVYSSYEEGNRFRMPTIDESGLSSDERKERVKEIYPEFVDELKEHMVVYGRTIKNLAGNESLVFKVTMTRCNDCDLPQSLDFSVKGSVLKDYDGNGISLENAVKKVMVKEN